MRQDNKRVLFLDTQSRIADMVYLCRLCARACPVLTCPPAVFHIAVNLFVAIFEESSS